MCRFTDTKKVFGHPTLNLSGEEYQAVAKQVEEGEVDASSVGCHGECVLHKELPYLHPQLFFLVPTWHCLLHGVVKAFLLYVLKTPGVLHPSGIAHVKQSAKVVSTTSEAGRRYKCVYDYL